MCRSVVRAEPGSERLGQSSREDEGGSKVGTCGRFQPPAGCVLMRKTHIFGFRLDPIPYPGEAPQLPSASRVTQALPDIFQPSGVQHSTLGPPCPGSRLDLLQVQ